MANPTTWHALRHCFTTPFLEDGHDIQTVQKLLAHKDVKMARTYSHVINRGGKGVRAKPDTV